MKTVVFYIMKIVFHFLILKLYHNIAYDFPSYIAPFLLVSQTAEDHLH